MTGTQSLLARFALGLSAGGAGLALTRARSYLTWPVQRFDRVWMTAFVVVRFALYTLVFGILRIAPRGDVPEIYTYEARRVLSGSLPYRDVYTSYAPLHPYLDAALLLLWNSPLILILFAILVEAAAAYLWVRIGRSFLPEDTLRLTAVLALTFPASLQFVAVDGQDNVLIALLLLAGLLLLHARKPFLSGVAVAAAAVFVKFLALLFVPVFFFAAARKLRWSAGLLVTLVAGYGPFALLHAPLLVPLQYEASLESAGNLPYAIQALAGAPLGPRLLDGSVLLVLFAVLVFLAIRFRSIAARQIPGLMVCSWAALTLIVLIFPKKSWPAYLLLTLFPICLVVVQSGMSTAKVICFELFGVVAITEHSFWSTVMHQPPALALYALLRAHTPPAFVLIILQLLLLAGYFALLYQALRQLAGSHPLRDMQSPPKPQPAPDQSRTETGSQTVCW